MHDLDNQQQAPNAESEAPQIDIEALTELVYRRFVDDLRRERDRAAWLD